jgi:hypothetical protein
LPPFPEFKTTASWGTLDERPGWHRTKEELKTTGHRDAIEVRHTTTNNMATEADPAAIDLLSKLHGRVGEFAENSPSLRLT